MEQNCIKILKPLATQNSLSFVILHRKKTCSTTCSWCLHYSYFRMLMTFLGVVVVLTISETVARTFLHPKVTSPLWRKNFWLNEKVVSKLELWMNMGAEHVCSEWNRWTFLIPSSSLRNLWHLPVSVSYFSPGTGLSEETHARIRGQVCSRDERFHHCGQFQLLRVRRPSQRG